MSNPTHCHACHEPLSDPASILCGYGRCCRKRLLADWSKHQLKATLAYMLDVQRHDERNGYEKRPPATLAASASHEPGKITCYMRPAPQRSDGRPAETDPAYPGWVRERNEYLSRNGSRISRDCAGDGEVRA